MADFPTLKDIKYINRRVSDAEYKPLVYSKISRHNQGIVHTKLWESIKHNQRHTLRMDQNIVEKILKKRGRRGRMGGRKGRPPWGLRHLIRRELCRLFHMETEKLVKILNSRPHYKSGKKKDITLVMPTLSIAIADLYDEIIAIDENLKEHPVFKRMWAPCACRLVELAWLNREKQSELRKNSGPRSQT